MSIERATLFTPDDLLTMPDGDRYELVDGHLVELGMGSWAGFVEGKLYYFLCHHSMPKQLGLALGSGVSYQCFKRNRVRKPDTSFILAGRLPEDRVPEGHIRIAPDLAVEVVSPTDIQYDVDRKVAEYLEAGVGLVWVVNPDTRVIIIYRADGSISGVRESGELDGEAAVPGFRCRVADLFIP